MRVLKKLMVLCMCTALLFTGVLHTRAAGAGMVETLTWVTTTNKEAGLYVGDLIFSGSTVYDFDNYQAEVYKDGQLFTSITGTRTTIPVSEHILTSGSYTVRVRLQDEAEATGYGPWSSMSEPFVYQAPTTSLDVPGTPVWGEGKRQYTLSDMSGYQRYVVIYWQDGVALGRYYTERNNNTTILSGDKVLPSVERCQLSVVALSDDITQMANSMSDLSEVRNTIPTEEETRRSNFLSMLMLRAAVNWEFGATPEACLDVRNQILDIGCSKEEMADLFTWHIEDIGDIYEKMTDNYAQDLGLMHSLVIDTDCADVIKSVDLSTWNAVTKNGMMLERIDKSELPESMMDQYSESYVVNYQIFTPVQWDFPVMITFEKPQSMATANNMKILFAPSGSDEFTEITTIYEIDNKKKTVIPIYGTGRIAFVVPVTGEGTTDGAGTSSGATGDSVKQPVKVITPELIEMYRYFNTEPINYEVSKSEAVLNNSMQGELCLAVFDTFKEDYTLASTYNFYADSLRGENTTYHTDEMIELTFTIPQAFQKEGRSFRIMIVSENGMPYTYEDLDQDPNTITIRTDRFYALGLLYKD